jgi:hypothetical protein
MACARSRGAEPAPDPSAVGGAVTAGRRRWRRWAVPRPYRLLLILFAGLQAADVVTTNHALAIPGISEANPLMALSQAHLGAAWWLPKVAVVGLVCFATPLTRRRWAMICVVSLYAAAVVGNLAHL